jgi:endonuclease/exonuclease/phosphatase family metal-dependent hydrolase
VVVTAAVAVCVLRATHADHRSAEIAVVGVTPLALLPAWPVAVVSGLRRHWVLGAVATAVVVCDVVWEGPILLPISRAPAPAHGAATWRLYDANVAQNNFHLSEIAHEIAVNRPDIVTLEELTPQAVESLGASHVLEAYHWRLVEARGGAGGMGVWARIPLTGLHAWTSEGTQVEIQGWIAPPRQPRVRFDVVHVYAPIGIGEPAEWRQQLAQVRDHLRAEPRPLVVAGDFNATADMGPFQEILHLGLSDAAVLAGKGWQMTWPRDQAWVLPYLRIDHVLISSELTVTGYHLGDGEGSDHHPLIVDIAPRAAG